MTDVRLTQEAAEHWASGITNDARLTQIAVEHWALVATAPPQVVMTQIAIEQWAPVAAAQQSRVWILA